mgnify:CR=1 FL=1
MKSIALTLTAAQLVVFLELYWTPGALLQAEGIDVNQATTDDGMTPLLWASKNGHVEVVRALHELGANLDAAMTDGATPAYIEVQNAAGTEVCTAGSTDAGCAELNGAGNNVYHSLNSTSTYYFSEAGTGSEPHTRGSSRRASRRLWASRRSSGPRPASCSSRSARRPTRGPSSRRSRSRR